MCKVSLNFDTVFFGDEMNQAAKDAGFEDKKSVQRSCPTCQPYRKYLKVMKSESALPYWKMERACLSNHGTLPTSLTNGLAYQILSEFFPDQDYLPVGMRKFHSPLPEDDANNVTSFR